MSTTTAPAPEDHYHGAACTDCLMLIANGDAPNYDPTTGEWMTEERAAEWLADFERFNVGTFWTISEWPGTEWTEDDRYCGRDREGHFSHDACTTCRSPLGGDRYPIIGWDEPDFNAPPT